MMGRIRSVIAVVLAVLACLVGTGSCQFQCNWAARFVQALQQRGGSEEACKVLSLPSAQFNQSHLLFEKQEVQKLPLIELPGVQPTLQGYADRYLHDAGAVGAQEPLNIVGDPVPNAFATGQMVFLYSGIIDWYLHPEAALMNLGLSQGQADQYLNQIRGDYPGQIGLLAVLAHETAHNVLGHPDVWPAAESCNQFIDAGINRVKAYEQEVATGRQPSSVGELLKNIVVNYAQTFADTQRQQRVESEADAYGSYLVWKETGDPQAMAKALRWLADFPGELPTSRSGAMFEALCSSHPDLLQRVSAAQTLAFSLTSSGTIPRNQIRPSPLQATAKRYQQFLTWYPQEVAALNRIAQGKLTTQEAQTTRTIRIETKPKGAMLSIDGRNIGSGPMDATLPLGPHQITATQGTRSGQLNIVVFSDAPKKVKITVGK